MEYLLKGIDNYIGDIEGTSVEIEVGQVNEKTPEMPFEDDDMLLDPEDYSGEE